MKKTVGILFSGYGEQFVTMGKDIYNESRQVQDLFEQASLCLDINFVQLCFASSDAEISSIDKGYLAILLTQVSIYNQLSQAGLRPDFIAGHGIGEYAAAVASGSLTFSDGLYLLNKYAKLFKSFMQEHSEYTVLQLSRGFTFEQLEQLCQKLSTEDKKIFISAHNTQEGFYVAGHVDLIDELQNYCKLHEIRKVKQLNPAYGFHNAFVDSLVATLSPYLFKIDFTALKFPVITNVDGVYVTSPDALESALLRQINAPILWDEVMSGFIGCQVLICVGPGKQLEQWAQLKYSDKEMYTIENLADLNKIIELLQADLKDVERIDMVEGQENHINLGACHLDDDAIVMELPTDLTIADEMNELPGDYDIDEDEQE